MASEVKAPTTELLPEKVVILGNTLKAISMPVWNNKIGIILASRVEVLEAIMKCESGGNSTICNKQYGCNGGMGLYGIIPTTLKYCEEKLERKLDPFNPNDNEACAVWLLENEGTRHWGTAETWWGSYDCWSKVANYK